MIFLIWGLLLSAALWLYLRQVYSRFSKYGVRHLKPIPLLGNNAKILFRMQHMTENVEENYNAFPDDRFVGSYEFVNPMTIIRDVDLIKKITVKDFEYFLNHRVILNEDTDPFFGRSLFSLQDQKWKDMRSTLSPAFTSSKIRLMVPFMEEVGDQMIKSLKINIKQSGNDFIDVDSKDLLARYANDVIASCAFGLKVDSHLEKDNQFYKMGKLATTFKFMETLKIFGYIIAPLIMKKLKIAVINKESTNFLRDLVMNTMKDREIKNIKRNDMIHLLMEAKKGKLTHEGQAAGDTDVGFATVEESDVGKKTVQRVWTDDDLTAQATLFFFAGFETVSTVMTFLLYELAVNPDIQDKLVKEIKETHQKNNGKIDYSSIQHMKYMDMVVSEGLRLWPPAPATDRKCVKDYNLGKANNYATDYIIRKGESIAIPIWAIHRSAEYFPDPLKFDPERFSEENKHNIKPFTYMPFGLGPRNCIASRFALCEVKVMLYQLLLHMVVSPAAKTCIPVKLSLESFNLRMKGGDWIRLSIRI
uniref:unspecific monooxygenase n=1 Tax=Zygaena filipendulae TaxID=287375 RepID=D2JLK7_9NEOP|nr:cytochrome P450 CYP9A36 [Zygaena filipendulae]